MKCIEQFYAALEQKLPLLTFSENVLFCFDEITEQIKKLFITGFIQRSRGNDLSVCIEYTIWILMFVHIIQYTDSAQFCQFYTLFNETDCIIFHHFYVKLSDVIAYYSRTPHERPP